MQVDYQEITNEEAKEIAGGSILGYVSGLLLEAVSDYLRSLAGPTV